MVRFIYLLDPSPLRRMTLRFGLAALAVLLALPTVSAQGISNNTPRRPVTTTVALTNARVVQAPGRVLDRATVVIRDGRIVAVGENANVPFDAHVIEADSFTVYAGFVDALGYAGVPKPEDPPPYEGDRGDPPRERAGLLPDRDVRGAYDPDHADVKALREAGFTAAHIAPRDGMLSGQGSIVLLRDPGRMEAAEGVVLAGPTSLVARIDPASGVYPGTTMGVLSVLRETVENARRQQAARTAFDERPGDTMRPRYDPVLTGLEPLLDGDRQLVFAVDDWLDGFRALRVTDELELSPILAGVPDTAPLIDRLRTSGTAVFAPLALPDTIKADSTVLAAELPTTTSPGGVAFVTDRRTASYRDTEAERTALLVQQRGAVRSAEQSPARLAEAEIPFAFATLDAKPKDLRANLRRMIAAGLAPDGALAALTTAPAQLLGLGGTLGTVERGKLANLIVATGDVFSDSTDLRFVLVEGVVHEIDKAKATPAADGEVKAEGTWDFSVPEAQQFGTLVIEKDGDTYTGTLTTADGETDPLENVTLDGSTLTFSLQVDDVGLATVTGTITGSEFEGTADLGPVGSFPMTATRRPE